MLNGKATIIFLMVGLIKRHKNDWKFFGWKLRIKLELSNYAAKADLKNARDVDK